MQKKALKSLLNISLNKISTTPESIVIAKQLYSFSKTRQLQST